MPKNHKTDKKLPKMQETNEQASNGGEDDANEANVATQQHMLLESISGLSSDIREFKKDMKRDLEELKNDVKTTMKKDLDKLREEMLRELQSQNASITEAQTRIAVLETACLEMKDTLLSTMKRNKMMCDKIVDLESRSRRNNIRIYGVPEEKEGKSVSDFVADLVRTHIKLPDGVELQIQRAHRALSAKPPPNAPPRSIIVNFLQFNVKELVLRKAWEQKVEMDGTRIYFDNDYAAEVMDKRKAYGPIKAALKQRGVRFQTPHTKMKIFWETGLRIYENADEAARDLINKGYDMVWTTKTTNLKAAEERLEARMPWQKVGSKESAAAGHRARERLTEFRRDEQ